MTHAVHTLLYVYMFVYVIVCIVHACIFYCLYCTCLYIVLFVFITYSLQNITSYTEILLIERIQLGKSVACILFFFTLLPQSIL